MATIKNDRDILLQAATAQGGNARVIGSNAWGVINTPLVKILNSSQIFTETSPGVYSPAGGITFSSTITNIYGTVTYEWREDGYSYVMSTSPSLTVSISQFTNGTNGGGVTTGSGALTGTSRIYTLIVYSNGVEVATDKCTISNTVDGVNPPLFTLTSTASTVVYADNKATTTTSGDITFTVVRQNLLGTPTFVATRYYTDATPSDTVSLSNTSPASDVSKILTAASFNAVNVKYITVKATIGTLEDSITVYRLNGGSDAVSLILSNEAHTLPASSTGAVSSYAGASTTVKVYRGTTDVTSSCSIQVVVSIGQTCTMTTSGATITINASSAATTTSVASPGSAPVLTLTAIGNSTDSGTITFNVTVPNVTGTVSKIFSLSKSKSGSAGSTAQLLTIVSSGQGFIYTDANSTAVSTSPTITFTPLLRNFSETIEWTATAYNASNTNLGAVTLTANGSNRELTAANFNALTGTRYVKVTATANPTSTLTDTISIYRLDSGTDAITVILSNESHTLPANSSGTVQVSDYNTANTTVKVFKGTSEITNTCTISASSTTVSGTINTSNYTNNGTAVSVVNQASVTVSVTSMGADSGTVSIGITIPGIAGTITKIFTLAKSRSGVSVYTATVYRQAATVNSTVTSGSYNFSTSTLTPPTGGGGEVWVVTQPASSTTPTWACDYTFIGVGTVSGGTWGTPYIEAVNGSAGTNGEYRDTIQLYLQSATTPTKPTSIPYTFSTNTIGTQTGGTAGWSMTQPASSTTPTYITKCLASTTTPASPVTLTAWSTPVIVARNGSDGVGIKGDTGARAPVYVKIAGTAWDQLAAYNAIVAATTNRTPNIPVKGDIVAYTGGAREYTGTSLTVYDSNAWGSVTNYIEGSLIATGTIAASALAANTVFSTQSLNTNGYITAFGNTSTSVAALGGSVKVVATFLGQSATPLLCEVGSYSTGTAVGAFGFSTNGSGTYGNSESLNGSGVYGYNSCATGSSSTAIGVSAISKIGTGLVAANENFTHPAILAQGHNAGQGYSITANGPSTFNYGTATFTYTGISIRAYGSIAADNNIVAYYSDDRLKAREGNITDALSKVRTLDTFYYRANETAQSLGYSNERLEVGVSAQQVQKILPEVVHPAPVSSEYFTIQYERLVPLLIAAIKELDDKLNRIIHDNTSKS